MTKIRMDNSYNPRIITVELFYQVNEREDGNGYYPITEQKDETYISIYEPFCLDDNGCWVQQYIYDYDYDDDDDDTSIGFEDYVAIKCLDEDIGAKLLAILNNDSRLLQIKRNVSEIEILQGKEIRNNLGVVLYPTQMSHFDSSMNFSSSFISMSGNCA